MKGGAGGAVITLVDKDALVYSRDLARVVAGLPGIEVALVCNVAAGLDDRPQRVRTIPLFFPATELSGPCSRLATALQAVGLRRSARYVEMILGYLAAFVVCLARGGIVVLSLSRYFLVEGIFVRALKRSGLRVVLVAHELPDPAAAELPTAGAGAARRAIRSLRVAGEVAVHGPRMRAKLEALMEAEGFVCRVFEYPHPRPVGRVGGEASDGAWDADALGVRNIDGETLRKRPALIFGFIGSIRPNKGMRLLFDAWVEALGTRADVALLVMGRPTYDTTDDVYHLRRSDTTNVYWRFAQLPDDEFERFFEVVDIVVLPYREGSQSGVLAHALAHRTAVLVTDVGDLAQAVPPWLADRLVVSCPAELSEALRDVSRASRAEVREWGAALDEENSSERIASRIREAFMAMMDP